MRRVGLHHVDIVASSLARSLPFYRDLLRPLGYVEAYEAGGERGETIWYLDGEGVGASLRIREAQSSSNAPYDRFRWAAAQGVAIENEPQEWPYVRGLLRD